MGNYRFSWCYLNFKEDYLDELVLKISVFRKMWQKPWQRCSLLWLLPLLLLYPKNRTMTEKGMNDERNIDLCMLRCRDPP